MAYKKLSTTALLAAKLPIDKAEPLYEKADAKTKKQMKTELELKAKKVQDVLAADIVVYKANAQERYTNIDNRLTRAIELVKKGQQSL